ALVDAGLGQILDGGDPLGGVGDVFAWADHGSALLSRPPPYLHFTHQPPPSSSPLLLNCQQFEEFRRNTQEQLLNVLTAQQKAKWKEMTGEPFNSDIGFGLLRMRFGPRLDVRHPKSP